MRFQNYRFVRACDASIISRHRTPQGAIRSAVAECRAQGLTDDGAYCSSDGWPSISDERTGERVDYPMPTVED